MALPLSVSEEACADLGGDTDGDGICDDEGNNGIAGDQPCSCDSRSPEAGCNENSGDNCPFFPNPGQEDDGGFNTTEPDGIGNACQCGDVNGNGVPGSTDGTLIKRSVAGLPPYGSVERMPFPGNCDVNGNGVCNTTDGTIVKRNWAGLTPHGVVASQLCPNANP